MLAPINSPGPRAFIRRGIAGVTVAGLALAGVALTGVAAANATGMGPVAGTTAWSTPYMTSITIDLCEGATDPEGDAVSLDGMDGALDTHGTFDSYDQATCTVGWTPDAGFSGPATFAFDLTDGTTVNGFSGVITVGSAPAANTAPVAADDWYSTPVSTKLIVAAPGALGNDSDAEGDAFILSALSQPSHGSVVMYGAGDFSYTPDTGYIGTDSFAYVIQDANGAESNWATVTIEVTAANQAPVAPNRAYQVEQDTPLDLGADWKTVALLDGATDPDGDALTVGIHFLQQLGGMLPGEALAFVDGTWRYTPPTDYIGTRLFAYVVTDGALSDNGDILFTIGAKNQAPVTQADAYTVQEGDTLTVGSADGLLANDSDPEGDAIAYDWSYVPMGWISIAADGSFAYTPATGFIGTDHLYYYAKDAKGAVSELTEVTITVTPDPAVNHAPEGVEDAYTGAIQGGIFTVDAAAGLLANDLDIDGDMLVVSFHTQPSYGTITWFDPATGAFTYQADPQMTGIDWFEYVVEDPSGVASNPIQVTIEVEPNAAELPVAGADEYWTTPGTPLVVAAPHHLLANDSDPNGDAFEVRAYGQPQHGTVTDFDFATGSFTWTPDAGFLGEDSMVYSLEDANGYVTDYFVVALHVSETLPPVDPENPEDPEGPQQPVAPEAPAAQPEDVLEPMTLAEAAELVVPLAPSVQKPAAEAKVSTTSEADASAAGTSAAGQSATVAGMPTWVLFAIAGLGVLAVAAVGIVRGLRARSNAERS